MAIGFVGIGNMGLPMADKLVGAADEFVVHDVREEAFKPLIEKQARPAATPREIGDRCRIAFVSLPTLDTLREVVLGKDGLIHGTTVKLVVNTCTVGVPLVGIGGGTGCAWDRTRRLPDQRRPSRSPRGHALGHGVGQARACGRDPADDFPLGASHCRRP